MRALSSPTWIGALVAGTLFIAILPVSVAVAPSFAGDLWQRPTLSGSWNGARTRLEDGGISLEALYTTDLISNVDGGLRQKSETLGNVDLLLTAELETLFGWRGARVFVYGLGNFGGNPSENVGDAQGVSNIEAVDTWKLYEAWLQQRLWGEKLALLVGIYDLNSELEVIPTADVFIHSSFGIGADFGLSGRNGPSIFPATSLGVRLEARPSQALYLRAVAMDGVPGDPDDPHGTHVILRKDDGLLLAGEIGFVHNPEAPVVFSHAVRHQREPEPAESSAPRRGAYGKYAVGVWGYTTDFDDLVYKDSAGLPERRDGTMGAYVLIEQRLAYEADDPRQGLTLFARAGMADDRVNAVNAHVGGGFVYKGLLPRRNRDRAGVGVAAAHFGTPFRGAVERLGEAIEPWEVTIELTYRVRLAPWLMLQPDIQYVIHPSGNPDVDNAVVVGARLALTL